VDHGLGLKVHITPRDDGGWCVWVSHFVPRGGAKASPIVVRAFITPPMRKVDACNVMRGTFEMHRTQRAAEQEARREFIT
jgi:hypothetical protein